MAEFFTAIMILYVKPGCSWCVDALRWMKARRLDFRVIDVFAEPAAFARMRSVSGQTMAPTLEMADGSVLPDFDVAQLEVFLKERGLV
jgi:glutaredoxin 3